MLVAELVARVERLAPPELAEEWDNVGLMVGRHNRAVRRVLVVLELRHEVLSEARELGCQAIVCHHPPIFPTTRAVTDDQPAAELVLSAAEAGVAVVAAHTNLDAAEGGLNDLMAGMLGLIDTAPLAPSPAAPAAGLGRVGRRRAPRPLEAVVREVAAAFGGVPLRYAGDPGARIETVACCTGSGASLIDAALASGADLYVTGDLKYHDADRASGLPLVSVHHAVVERAALKAWSRVLGRALAEDDVEVRFAETDTDPWQFA